MTKINDGGPAFPAHHFDLADNEHGMTLRDWFATHTSEGDIKAHGWGPNTEQVLIDHNGMRRIEVTSSRRTREQARYAYADEMLRAREANE